MNGWVYSVQKGERTMLENLQLQDEGLTVNIAGKANVDFEYFWFWLVFL